MNQIDRERCWRDDVKESRLVPPVAEIKVQADKERGEKNKLTGPHSSTARRSANESIFIYISFCKTEERLMLTGMDTQESYLTKSRLSKLYHSFTREGV